MSSYNLFKYLNNYIIRTDMRVLANERGGFITPGALLGGHPSKLRDQQNLVPTNVSLKIKLFS